MTGSRAAPGETICTAAREATRCLAATETTVSMAEPTGGANRDGFFFDTSLGASNIDKIMDFSTVDDTIDLENAIFTAFRSSGTMSSSAFYVGAAAHDSTDRIIYNSDTGALSYDPDGTGSAAAVQFAELSTKLALTYQDFLIV